MQIDIASFGRAALYLGVPFILLVFFMQWRWSRTCDKNIQILVAQRGGGGDYRLAPKSGGDITIKNPDTGDTRTWPINELATIDVPYPGLGFLPRWMQKSIRLAIVNEGDWEPMLNRSPHRKKIASPDVVAFIESLREDNAEKNPEIVERINAFLNGISTGPTREMVGDPAMLGDLMRSGVMKALATVSDELMEALKNVTRQLSRLTSLNATVVYIGLGLSIAIGGFLVYELFQIAPNLKDMADLVAKIDSIRKALGVV